MDILIVIGTAIGIIIAAILSLCAFALLITILDSDYGCILLVIPIAIFTFYVGHEIAVYLNWIEPFLPMLN